MKKILIIDDAEYILDTTAAILKFEGYQIQTSTNGKLALNLLKEFHPDLILCDISMPKMDGFAFLEKIRLDNNYKRTPFIFLTAFADKSNVRLGMEKGADDYLVKPFTRDELISAINAQFKKHQYLEQQLEEKVTKLGQSIVTVLPHEFRTVLNQISGTARYINSNYNSISADDLFELTNDILSSTERLIKITENYLIYARLESFTYSKTKRLLLRSFKTDEPIPIIKDIALHCAKKYQRESDLIFEEGIQNIYCELSTESFYKIFSELIDNAFSFSEKGQSVKISSKIISDNFIEFCIEDKGRGMSENQINSIGMLVQFERNVYEQQGLGLGLSISKKIVELHDGEFKIDSKIGNGTKIIFTLPFKKLI